MKKIGTVLPHATIKFLDDSGDVLRWVTVAKCIDSPRHVREAIESARSKNPDKQLWVHHVYGKELVNR